MDPKYLSLINDIREYQHALDSCRMPIEGRTVLLTEAEHKILLEYGYGDEIFDMTIVFDPERHRDSEHMSDTLESMEALN